MDIVIAIRTIVVNAASRRVIVVSLAVLEAANTSTKVGRGFPAVLQFPA